MPLEDGKPDWQAAGRAFSEGESWEGSPRFDRQVRSLLVRLVEINARTLLCLELLIRQSIPDGEEKLAALPHDMQHDVMDGGEVTGRLQTRGDR